MGPAEVKALRSEVLARIDAAADSGGLEAVRIEWLGRKSGRITALMKEIPRSRRPSAACSARPSTH